MKLTIKTRYTLPPLNAVLFEKLPDLLLLAYIIFLYVWNYSIGFNEILKYGSHFLALSFFFLLAIFKLRCIIIAPFEKIFFAFVVFCGLSAYFAIDKVSALRTSATLFVYFMILVSIHIYVAKRDKLDWFIFSLCFGGIALALYNFYFYGVGNYLLKLASGLRVGGEITNVNTIGRFCSFSAIICFWYATYKDKVQYYAPMILCTFIALGSGSRKSLVALIFGCCVLYLLKGTLRQKLTGVVRMSVFLIGFMMILQLPLFERVATRFESFLSVFDDSDSTAVDNSTYLRSMFIKSGLEYFFSSPFMGVGINNAHFIAFRATGYDYYLHNNYVELLASIGIIGTLLYYLLYLYPLAKLLRPALNHDKIAVLFEMFLILDLLLDFGSVSYLNIDNYFLILAAHLKVSQLEKKSGGT